MKKLSKTQILLISIPMLVVLSAVIIFYIVWGISRADLETQRRRPIEGTWQTYDWAQTDTFSVSDYPSFVVEDGQNFNVLALTDVHYRNDGWYGDAVWTLNSVNKAADKNIDKLILDVDPDLIIVTGDLVTGSLNDLLYQRFATFIDKYDIAWTVTFGNHDGERRADKPALMNIMQATRNCIFQQGPTNLGTEDEPLAGGLGNYLINLVDTNGAVFHSFIMADSGDWQNMQQNQDANVRGEHNFSRVGVGFTDRQIAWYEWALKGLETFNNSKSATYGMPKSTMYMHIAMKAHEYGAILGDYTKAAEYPINDLPFHPEAEWSRPINKSLESKSNEFIRLYFNKVNGFEQFVIDRTLISDADNSLSHTQIQKEIAKGYATHASNDLFFSKVKQLGSTKTFVTGHSHSDGYSVEYDGITYIAVVKTSDIYVDKEWDGGNRGGTRLLYKKVANGAEISSKPYFHRFDNFKSTKYPRPIV